MNRPRVMHRCMAQLQFINKSIASFFFFRRGILMASALSTIVKKKMQAEPLVH